MDPWALLGLGTLAGMGSFGSSALSSIFNYQAQKKMDSKAYARQVALLQMQQNFAERMSSTAHQREVADLRKAGLNPILSATGGQGASSPVVSAPGVSTGSKVDADFGNPVGAAIDAVATASSAKLNDELGKKAKADATSAAAQARKTNAEAVVAETKARLLRNSVTDRAEKSGNLLFDGNTWRGIRDYFTGASSARQSFTPNRRVTVDDVLRDPQRYSDYLMDDDSSGRHSKNNTNGTPKGSYHYYDRDGKVHIVVKKPYVPKKNGGKK